MKSAQIISQLQKFAQDEVGDMGLQPDQRSILVTMAQEATALTSDISRLAMGRTIISLCEKWSKGNVKAQRTEEEKLENSVLSSYTAFITRGMAQFRLSNPNATDDDRIAHEMKLDADFMKRQQQKAAAARARADIAFKNSK